MSKQPKYVEIENKITEAIKSGKYPEGSELPSENEMINYFGVSRITIRRVADDLYRAGYIEKHQGKRGFVRSLQRVQELTTISSYTEEILRQGMKPLRKIISSGLRLCNSNEQQILNLDKVEAVFYMERIIYADDQPLCYTCTALPYNLFRDIENYNFEQKSLYDVIEHVYQVKITHSTLKLKAVTANKQIAQYLDIDKDVPLLYSSAVTYGICNGAEVPIEKFETYYLTDRFEYTLTQKR